MTDLMFCLAAALAAGVYLAPPLNGRKARGGSRHSPR